MQLLFTPVIGRTERIFMDMTTLTDQSRVLGYDNGQRPRLLHRAFKAELVWEFLFVSFVVNSWLTTQWWSHGAREPAAGWNLAALRSQGPPWSAMCSLQSLCTPLDSQEKKRSRCLMQYSLRKALEGMSKNKINMTPWIRNSTKSNSKGNQRKMGVFSFFVTFPLMWLTMA